MKILQDFQTEFPDLVRAMRQSTHHTLDGKNINPYHMEGDVWSHTMMVLHSINSNYVPDPILPIQRIIAILHDTGKTLCRKESAETGHVSFYGHPGVSFYIACDVLPKIAAECRSQWVSILQAINLHHQYFDFLENPYDVPEEISDELQSADLAMLLWRQMEADNAGRFLANQPEVVFWRKHRALEIWMNQVYRSCRQIEMDKVAIDPQGPTVTLMVGPPASGKSTYAHTINGATVISRDEFVYMLGEGDGYTEKFKNVDQNAVDAAYRKALLELIDSKKDIVIDKTHMSPKSRRHTLSMIPRTYTRRAVVMATGFEEVCRRNNGREDEGKVLDGSLIIDMMRGFTVPLYGEFEVIDYVF